MNGKIKTKFAALFAVALMITVCVVPMVGGSEDVEAATTTETIDISGIVKDAAGTAITTGVEVYIEGSELTDIAGNDGTFEFENVPVKNSIMIKVNVNEYLSDGKTVNPVSGYTFATITLTGATQDVKDLVLVAGTVNVSGSIVLMNNSVVGVKGISINGAEGSVVTKEDGTFTFVAKAYKSYELSASFAGVEFKADKFTTSNSNASGKNLKAQSNMIASSVAAPIGNIVTESTDTSKTAKVTLGSPTFVEKASVNMVYIPISYTAETDTSKITDVKVTLNYGINGIKSNYITISGTSGDVTTPFTSTDAGKKVTVGGIAVKPNQVTLKAEKTASTPELNYEAYITDMKFYVGAYYVQDDGTWSANPVTGLKVDAKYGAYTFNQANSITDMAATNAAKVTVNADTKGTSFSVSATDAVVAQTGYKTSSPASGTPTFDFYVPKGTSVTITAPSNYVPASESISAVNSDVVVVFKYDADIIYKGEVLLNGVPVSIDAEEIWYATNGKTFVNDTTGDIVKKVEPAKGTPYYTISLNRDVDVSKMKVKLEVDAGGYSFESNVADPNYTVPVGVTGTTIGAFDVKVTDISFNITDANSLILPGMEVSLVMVGGSTYDDSFVVADLGKAETDVFGVAKFTAATPVSGYTLFAIPSGECEYGEYTFAIPAYSTLSITALEDTWTGYYTDDGSELKGFAMSFIANDASGAIAYGDAKIIGNKYYIVAPAATTDVDVKLADGFKSKTMTPSFGYYTIPSTLDIDIIEAEPKFEEFSVINMTGAEYVNFVKISEVDDDIKEGTVIVLSAEKTCYKLQNEMYGYKYSDAAVECTFAGWYVNGKLLTEDCDASLTLTEDVVIVAQYEEAIKVIGSQDVPEAGLDTNVLILGIVVVVIALIAVVYSVISKRD